jgi:hypothetical protein
VPGCDAGLHGSKGDDKLLELAQRHLAPPLINEGYSIEGVLSDDPKRLRARANSMGFRCTRRASSGTDTGANAPARSSSIDSTPRAAEVARAIEGDGVDAQAAGAGAGRP